MLLDRAGGCGAVWHWARTLRTWVRSLRSGNSDAAVFADVLGHCAGRFHLWFKPMGIRSVDKPLVSIRSDQSLFEVGVLYAIVSHLVM